MATKDYKQRHKWVPMVGDKSWAILNITHATNGPRASWPFFAVEVNIERKHKPKTPHDGWVFVLCNARLNYYLVLEHCMCGGQKKHCSLSG